MKRIMKTKTKQPTKMAACLGQQTATQVKRQNEAYRNLALLSREKIKVGTLLLILQTPLNREQREEGWQMFENLLRRYLELKTYR